MVVRTRRKNPTSKDIAHRLGINQSTVSRALHGRSASQEMIAKVQKVAEELGYRPHAGARLLVSGRSHSICLMFPEVSDPYQFQCVAAFHREARKLGYHIVLAPYEKDDDEFEEYGDYLVRERRVDGIIIYGIVDPRFDEVVARIASRNVPALTVGPCSVPNVHLLNIDYDKFRQDVARHLADLGHRRIGAILNIVGDLKSVEAENLHRMHVFQNTLKARGISWSGGELLHMCVPTIENGYKAAQHLLRLKPRPTAIYTSKDVLALGVLQAARDRAIRVPEDLSITGFENTEISEFFDITTGECALEEVASKAIRIVVEVLDKGFENTGVLRDEVKPVLIVRGSTGQVSRIRQSRRKSS